MHFPIPHNGYRFVLFASLAAWLTGTGTLRAQGPIITVFPALAPNVFGSPSFPTWESNNISALELGASSAGDPALPSFYQQIPNGSIVQAFLVSNFPSWRLRADPGTVFGQDFAGEFGNRLYFGLHIVGNGQQFSLSQLTFTATTSDPGNFLGFSVTAGSYNYGTGFVGLNYGPDGIKGTPDDFFVTGGVNTQLIDELFARGSGSAPDVLDTDPGTTLQDKIDLAAAALPVQFVFNGAYTLETGNGTFGGSAFVIVGIPEPATLVISGVGACGMALCCCTLYRRRRRRHISRRKNTHPKLGV